MDAINPSVMCWGIVAIQVLGLASMGLARLQLPRVAVASFQLLFFGSLVAVGIATMWAIGLGSGN